jgi:hypothetical protein
MAQWRMLLWRRDLMARQTLPCDTILLGRSEPVICPQHHRFPATPQFNTHSRITPSNSALPQSTTQIQSQTTDNVASLSIPNVHPGHAYPHAR